MPCSTMVVRFAVNEVVVGSSPTGAVRRLTRVTIASLALFWPNKNDALGILAEWFKATVY